MLTINELEVRFDVEGSDDRTTFARLFREHIEQWERRQTEGARRARQEDREREMPDRRGGSR